MSFPFHSLATSGNFDSVFPLKELSTSQPEGGKAAPILLSEAKKLERQTEGLIFVLTSKIFSVPILGGTVN